MTTTPVAILVACMSTTGLVSDQSLDVDSLRNLMGGLQHEQKDVEFVYEGSLTVTRRGRDEPQPPTNFQGTFALRSDGSAHLGIYIRSTDQRLPLDRSILCLSRANGFQTLDFQPDRGNRSKNLSTAAWTGPSVLDRPFSPFRIFRAPLVCDYLKNAGDKPTSDGLNYECLGWETVDGHRCVKVRFAAGLPGARAPSREYVYWLDLERGGNPLKYEDRMNGQLLARTDEVRLEAFPVSAGRKCWLPVHGVFRSYLGGVGADKKPKLLSTANCEERCDIVNGTVRLNQGLRDDRFSLGWSGAPATESLRAIRLEYDRLLRGPRQSAPSGETIDQMIAEAERQGKLLEASSPSRAPWAGTSLGSWALAVVGTMCMVCAWVFRRRLS